MEVKEKIVKYSVLIVAIIALTIFSVFAIGFKNNSVKINSTPENKIVDIEKEIVATTTKTAISKAGETKVKEVPSCENSGDFECYNNYYSDIVNKKGVAAAFNVLKKEYDTSSYVRSQCHPITHVIGRVASAKYKNVFEAYKYGDPICWSGYYHGVMEEIVEKVGLSKIKTELDNICNGIPGKERYSFDYYNCVHGLGHGLMAVTDNELFDSLKYCDNLVGDWEKNSCYGGVFMENVIVDNKNHFTKYLKPKEPLYPCNAVEEPYKSQCYLMQTSYMLKVTSGDFSKVFGLCRNADVGYQAICFQSLGRDASGQTISDPERTREKCELGADYVEKSNCIIGAVKDFVSYHHSDKQAYTLCSIVTDDLKNICTETTASYYKSL